MNQKVKLDDSVIAHIVKLIQLGLLQGLDIVDYFRQIVLVAEEGNPVLTLDSDYENRHEEEIEFLMAKVQAAPSEDTDSEEENLEEQEEDEEKSESEEESG